MKIILNIILLIVTIFFLSFQAHLWFNADCSTVKEYWYLTATPARCI